MANRYSIDSKNPLWNQIYFMGTSWFSQTLLIVLYCYHNVDEKKTSHILKGVPSMKCGGRERMEEEKRGKEISLALRWAQ